MVFLNDLDGPYARILQQSSNFSNVGGYITLNPAFEYMQTILRFQPPMALQ